MGNDLLVTSMSLHTRARNILYNLNWKTINDSWVAMETITSNSGNSKTATYAAF